MRKYGVWSGRPKGMDEDLTRCVVSVGGRSLWGPADAHQCGSRRGHGTDGLFCMRHAHMEADRKPLDIPADK